MKFKYLFITLLCLNSCSTIIYNQDTQNMNTSPFVQFDDFVCRHAPKYTNNGDDNFALYNYAKYTELHSRHKKQNVWHEVLPYLRLAAANGDTLANIRLQTYLIYRKIPDNLKPKKVSIEILDLNDKLLAQQLPVAYYRKSQYINMGLYRGTSQDADAYLRRAADLGDKDAQYDIGNRVFRNYTNGTTVTNEMKLPYLLKLFVPAAEQGHLDAAITLSVFMRDMDEYRPLMMRCLHLAAKGPLPIGEDVNLVLHSLRMAFNYPNDAVNSRFFKLDKPDIERGRRYGVLSSYAHSYSHLNPAFPDLDDIVPLPPAKLPEWDGKSAFQRWYEGPPPPKPSDELVHRLAQQYGLDPTTGLPLKR